MQDDFLPVTDHFVKIPLRDGRRLSARLWRPDAPGRFPAILEFSPYRVWDLYRGYGDALFPHWAARGYAVLAIDIAGSGASDGLLLDEYMPGEIDDALVTMEWCAAQTWCDGALGLSGFSWSAFTALRVSDRRPAGLKAMVLGGVSDDGWRNDIHALGGLHYLAEVDWTGVMQMFNALPPDPAQHGEGWREAWKARLEANRPWIEQWLSHQGHDAYWRDKRATLASDVPLYLYCGLADKFADSALRIARRWRGPVRTLLGPWEHSLPHIALRKPRIDIIAETTRWWDAWLKGRDAGVLADPPLRIWIASPDAKGRMVEGEWLAGELPGKAQTLSLQTVADGWRAVPARTEAIEALTADLYEDVPAPLVHPPGDVVAVHTVAQDDLIVAGAPSLHCRVRSSAPGGQLIARLIDRDPLSGRSVRISTGALALDVGEHVIGLDFRPCGWRLARGHQLLVMLSSNGMPTFWPPDPGTEVSVSKLELVLPSLEDAQSVTMPPPPPLERPFLVNLLWLDSESERVVFPAIPGAAVREATTAHHHLRETGTDYLIRSRYEAGPGARAAKSYRIAVERPGFSIRIDCRLEVARRDGRYQIGWQLEASDYGKLFHKSGGMSEVP